jgi:DNA polymerase III sliding clamp (beta) subunit (PCNA family)
MIRSELVSVLELVKPALAKTNMVPVFQCFCFADRVSAYDDQIAIVGPTDFDVGGPVGLHGATLLGLLSSSGAKEIEFTQAGNEVTLKMGKSTSKMPFVWSQDFIFTVPDDKWAFKLPFTESLFEALKLALETVSSDATQAALLGVTIQGDKMYGCNSDSLTRIVLKGTIGKNRVLMSTPFCEAVIKLWSSLAITKGTLHFSSDWVFADFGEWSVYGRILEIQEPIDFEALISKNVKKGDKTQPVPEGFSEALSRARVLSDPESQKTTITVEKGKLNLHTETHMGEVKDSVAFKGHPDIKVNVNASHLQSAIKNCDQIAFLDNCALLEKAPDVLQIVSNMS